MDYRKAGSIRQCLSEIWKTRVSVLFLSRFVVITGLCCLVPYLQTELTDYFLHKHTDKDMKCTGDHHHGPPPGVAKQQPGGGQPHEVAHPDGAGVSEMDARVASPGMHGGPPPHGEGHHHGPPKECIKAHTDVLLWTTGRTIVTAFTISLFFNAAIGTWSDMYGRKPFLIYITFMHIVQYFVVLLYLKVGLPLYWYFIIPPLAVPFNSQSISLAFIADKISGTNCLMAFGMLLLVFSLSIISGTSLTLAGVVSSMEMACYVGIGLTVVATFILVFFLPESLTEEIQLKARNKEVEKRANGAERRSWHFYWSSFVEAMKILWRTPFFRRLTIINFIVMMVSEEYIEFKTQYLQEVVHFGTSEQAAMMMVMGLSGMFILTVGLWLVTAVLNLSDKQILLIGTIMLSMSFLFLAACQSAWMAYVSTGLMSFWMFLAIAISSMKAANVREEEQGAVQGALSAVSQAGFGLGPVLFLLFYVAFRHGSVYIPGAPFYFGFFLMLVTVIITMTLKPPERGTNKNEWELPLERMEANDSETASLLVEKEDSSS